MEQLVFFSQRPLIPKKHFGRNSWKIRSLPALSFLKSPMEKNVLLQFLLPARTEGEALGAVSGNDRRVDTTHTWRVRLLADSENIYVTPTRRLEETLAEGSGFPGASTELPCRSVGRCQRSVSWWRKNQWLWEGPEGFGFAKGVFFLWKPVFLTSQLKKIVFFPQYAKHKIPRNTNEEMNYSIPMKKRQ